MHIEVKFPARELQVEHLEAIAWRNQVPINYTQPQVQVWAGQVPRWSWVCPADPDLGGGQLLQITEPSSCKVKTDRGIGQVYEIHK